ncbi:hypothetical protein GY45DRAFT_1345955 [Cubamyces sp. BRFM 1775]|nr:hypothetical protein GY45DRAFT_1345955 [Cubamyces sp. BRFM 1775]
MSSAAYTRWDMFVGVMGVLTAVPVVYCFIAIQLPSRKVKALFESFTETDALFEGCIEEGLLKEHHIQEFRAHLKTLRRRANEVRAQVLAARTFREDVTNWAKGLTFKINQIHTGLTDVRATISTTSTREREERERAEAAQRAATGCGVDANDPNGSASHSHTAGTLYNRLWLALASAPFLSRWSSMRTSTGGNADALDCLPVHHASGPPAVLAIGALVPSCLPSASQDTVPYPEQAVPRGNARLSNISPALPSDASSVRSSRYRPKHRGNAYTRARALCRFVQRCRKQRTKDAILVSLADLSRIEELDDDDDDDDWEDLQAAKVQIVV